MTVFGVFMCCVCDVDESVSCLCGLSNRCYFGVFYD